jgi:hypothetical protein
MSPDPWQRDLEIIGRMAHTLAGAKSPLGDTWGAMFEAKNDLLDAGFSLPAINRHFNAARQAAGRM